MKKLLTFLLFLPLTASAQQLRLGVGVNFNTKLSIYRNVSSVHAVAVSPAVSLGYLHPVFRHFELGAEVSATNWRNRTEVIITDPTNPNGGLRDTKLDVFMARPAVSYGVLANYHPRFGRHSVRAGLYAGGVHGSGKKINEPFPTTLYLPNTKGLVFGGQLGYEFAVTKRIAVGLECAPRYARFSADFPASLGIPAQKVRYSLWYFPTLATLSVRL